MLRDLDLVSLVRRPPSTLLRTVRFGVAALVVSSAVASACKSSGISLSVDLRTDYLPGRELVRVETEVVPAGSDSRKSEHPVGDNESGFVEGARVADFGDVPAGDLIVRVNVYGKEEAPLVTRVSRLTVQSDYALTVVVTRSCEGVVCPEPGGDPALSTCDRGHCAKPECTPQTPQYCGAAQCSLDADCKPDVACVNGRCEAGACLYLPDDKKCKPTQTCDAAEGCTPPDSTCSATEDTETTCGDGVDNDCDGKIDCGDPDCETKACEDGDLCTSGETCNLGKCVGGGAASCDDMNPCTDDACDSKGGCTHTNKTGGSCDDGDACTSGDTCKDGACAAGGPTDCDDKNVCTDDTCDSKLGCQHANNTGPCDDATFCNGADTCSSGACTVHAGNPCKAPAVCDESKRACVGCTIASDCGPVTYGAWGACGGFADTCDTSGTQSRTVTTPSCGAGGVCTYATTTETQACSRTTNGASCGAGVTYSAYSSCSWTSACDTSASKTRTKTTYTCSSGSCVGTNTTETASCTRTVANGTSCGSGKYCCGGGCVAINSASHCSSCGIKCASGVCAGIGSGHYACTCSSNAECQSDGFGSGATCWSPTGGTLYCNCQCTTANCCAGGADCYKPSGLNYCSY